MAFFEYFCHLDMFPSKSLARCATWGFSDHRWPQKWKQLLAVAEIFLSPLLQRQQFALPETVQWSRQSLLQRNPMLALAKIAQKKQLLLLRLP